MERRELLKMIAVLTGGVVIGGDVFLSGCTNKEADASTFSASNIALLDEVGETIIPTTSTPGAKATKIGEFMKTIVTDCYNADQQKAFGDGLAGLNAACEKANGKSFMDATPDQRKAFLIGLEKEAKEYNKQRDEKEKDAREKARKDMDPNFVSAPSHYYSMLKQLTLWGYFSSEIGSKQALRFLPIPGHYDGALPYKKGDKAWAI
ncbi:gluconate 2-dehydrogenase subunit 3 family protein [Ferruginibacter sp. SUN106]|uniref:gluconate 2-dehydrogenase subunit 3 family protein n=1 Tax=Ferruginibacter sp. SUN106 TaxID=2978348 RepID=UPI003D369796